MFLPQMYLNLRWQNIKLYVFSPTKTTIFKFFFFLKDAFLSFVLHFFFERIHFVLINFNFGPYIKFFVAKMHECF